MPSFPIFHSNEEWKRNLTLFLTCTDDSPGYARCITSQIPPGAEIATMSPAAQGKMLRAALMKAREEGRRVDQETVRAVINAMTNNREARMEVASRVGDKVGLLQYKWLDTTVRAVYASYL